MNWRDRTDGTSTLDLPGDDWAVIQPMGRGEARGIYAMRLRRPEGQDARCVDFVGPFPFNGGAALAKQAAERSWT